MYVNISGIGVPETCENNVEFPFPSVGRDVICVAYLNVSLNDGWEDPLFKVGNISPNDPDIDAIFVALMAEFRIEYRS